MHNPEIVKVSVIVPAYNSGRMIEATLRSILDQQVEGLQLIVVDDGSSDGTASVAAAFDPRVRVVRQENAGIAAARNTGLQHAKAPLIAFCDHDDIWHRDKLRAQVAVFERDPDVGIVFGEFLNWDDRQPLTFPDSILDSTLCDERRSGWIYPELLMTNWVLMSTAVVRREVFDKIGLFDPRMPPADDWDIAVRASRHFRFIKLRQPVVLYRQHAGQTNRKPLAQDVRSDARDRFIQQFGYEGPDGRVVDRAELQRRRYVNRFSHARMTYHGGLYSAASGSFRQAWRLRPLSVLAAGWWLVSSARAVLSRNPGK